MRTPPYFKRNLYIERIRPFINTEMIKVIVGQRRVGKSYLLYQLMDEIRILHPKADLVYINKELYDFDAVRNHIDLIEYVRIHRKNSTEKCYLFIDEIQDIAEFEKALRHFFAEGSFDIYCTGSNAHLLSGELATYLSGRYIEFKVYSLNYSEFIQFNQLKDSDQAFARFYKTGGLPYLTNLPNDDAIRLEYLKNIYHTILLKDLVDRYKIRNIRNLTDLVLYLADTVGNLFSANRISEYLKSQYTEVQTKTILEYLAYLSNAFLIHRISPIDLQGKKLLRIGEKYYFEDLGVRNCIRPFQAHAIGQILENVVCNHLLTQNYTVYLGRNVDKEIDFVAEKNGERLYIQVATTLLEPQTREREFGNLLAIRDNYPKIVVTLDSAEGVSYEGIQQIPIRRFLLQ